MSDELSVIDPVSAHTAAQAAQSNWSGWSDSAGMVASIGCAIHCAAMPFVIGYLPALGLSFLADEAFHKWMAVGCFAIALAAFIPGLRKHGRLAPVVIGSVGLAMISVAAFGFAGECCAACESNAALATAGDTNTCTDDCCPPCDSQIGVDKPPGLAANGLVASSTASVRLPSELSQLGSRIAPWLTPLGGIVLVVAHLLNRRLGCLCGCGESESVRASA